MHCGCQKWTWPFRTWNSKICSISIMNWWNELFFAYWYKFRKAKSCFYIYWVGMVKNEWGLIDHWALQWGVSHNWFDELSRNDFCMLIVMEYCLVWQTIYSVSLTFKCWRATAVVLNQGFYEKFPLGTNGPKIGFILKNFVIDFCWKHT